MISLQLQLQLKKLLVECSFFNKFITFVLKNVFLLIWTFWLSFINILCENIKTNVKDSLNTHFSRLKSWQLQTYLHFSTAFFSIMQVILYTSFHIIIFFFYIIFRILNVQIRFLALLSSIQRYFNGARRYGNWISDVLRNVSIKFCQDFSK